MCLHWELSTRLPSPAHGTDEHRGHPSAGGLGVSVGSDTRHPAASLSQEGPPHPEAAPVAVVVRGCRQRSCRTAASACFSWPSSPGSLDRDRQTPAHGPCKTLWPCLWGTQDRAGYTGGAQGDMGSPTPPAAGFPAPASASAWHREVHGAELCSAAGLNTALLLRACGHIFSLTIFNPYFASSPLSLFSLPLSRQQNKKICITVCGKE